MCLRTHWVRDLKWSFNGRSLVPCGGPCPGPKESLPHSWVTKVQLHSTLQLNMDVEKSSNC